MSYSGLNDSEAAMATSKSRVDTVKYRVDIGTRLIHAHDRLFSNANKSALKYLVIKLSILGFAVHLLLILLARSLDSPLLLREIGTNYLTAISTPFSFILFYEVLTLIAALPASTTLSIANQFEVVSLIFARDAFKDAQTLQKLVKGHEINRDMLPVFLNMWAGLTMFFLVAVFQYVALQRVRPIGTPERTLGLERFVMQKKIVAIGLTMLLLGMAAYNLALTVRPVVQTLMHRPNAGFFETSFYNDLFTVMIFTDVLVLILSLVVSGQYAMVFRNAAFVISIILIRVSLTEAAPYGAALALVAMVFGIGTLLVFNFHMKLQHEYAAGRG